MTYRYIHVLTMYVYVHVHCCACFVPASVVCYCYTIIILQPNVGIQRLALQTRVFVLHVDARLLHVVDLRSWSDADQVYTMQLAVLQLLPNDEGASVEFDEVLLVDQLYSKGYKHFKVTNAITFAYTILKIIGVSVILILPASSPYG